jgi:hypothetical protein
MPTGPTGPADWHLAVGFWQWDHYTSDDGNDYLSQEPSITIYDYEHGYNSVYDLHLQSWGNRATCAALYRGPGYQDGDHCDLLADCNNTQGNRMTLDPNMPPNPNPDHPDVLFYMFKNNPIGEHGVAGFIFVIAPSSPVAIATAVTE